MAELEMQTSDPLVGLVPEWRGAVPAGRLCMRGDRNARLSGGLALERLLSAVSCGKI